MRWLLVAAMTLAACGGADDEVFGGDDAGTAVHYGPHGLPDCETVCDAKHKAYCDAPGHTAEELAGSYVVVETASDDNTTTWTLDTKAEDGRLVAYCWTINDRVAFTSH